MGLEIAKRSFDNRLSKRNGCWYQDSIVAAFLGLTKTASTLVTESFTLNNMEFRFPVFWKNSLDWTPDQDHGGVASMALQSMLLQHDGDKIIIFPAWPKEIDVDFKLHAPRNTLIECSLKNGEIKNLTVSPASRKKDVLNMLE